MRIFYNGTDITAACCPEEAIYYDRTGKADSLELTLPFGERWISWGTEEGDTLRVTRDGCDTGEMYITAAELDSGKFRVLATAAKPKCRKRGTGSTAEPCSGSAPGRREREILPFPAGGWRIWRWAALYGAGRPPGDS